MEKSVKHRFLNSVLFTALLVPLGFFLLRDTIIAITGIMFESIGGKESFLYQINEDIARLIIAGLLILIMPLFFRGKCNFGFRGGKLALGICLALPELIVPVWNLLQIKVYEAPLVAGAAAVAAAIMHGIGPGVSEEGFCRGFTVSNLMRIWKDKPLYAGFRGFFRSSTCTQCDRHRRCFFGADSSYLCRLYWRVGRCYLPSLTKPVGRDPHAHPDGCFRFPCCI